MWRLEAGEGRSSAPVQWGGSYRLRHIQSGQLLAVQTSAAPPELVKQRTDRLRQSAATARQRPRASREETSGKVTHTCQLIDGTETDEATLFLLKPQYPRTPTSRPQTAAMRSGRGGATR